MGIEYEIDSAHRLVRARAHGVLTLAEVLQYQTDVFSKPEVVGYNELFDATAIDEVETMSSDWMMKLAFFSATVDSPTVSSKLAVVASKSFYYGLGRMYQAYRDAAPGATKQTRVFRDMDSAFRWFEESDAQA